MMNPVAPARTTTEQTKKLPPPTEEEIKKFDEKLDTWTKAKKKELGIPDPNDPVEWFAARYGTEHCVPMAAVTSMILGHSVRTPQEMQQEYTSHGSFIDQQCP